MLVRRNAKTADSARLTTRGFLISAALLALLSLACFTLTLTTNIGLDQNKNTQVGMQLMFELDRDVSAAFAGEPQDRNPTSQIGKAFSDLAKSGWKLSQSDNGRIVNATKNLQDLDQLKSQGWKLEERQIGPGSIGRIVTATYDINQLKSSGLDSGTFIQELSVILDESDPVTTTWIYKSKVVIPRSTPSLPERTGPQLPTCQPADLFVKPCQLFGPNDLQLTPRENQALQNAGAPKLVLAATMPYTIAQSTLNGVSGGTITNDTQVRWIFPIDKPGTFFILAVAHARNHLPVIFLPGVAGSELNVEGNLLTTQVWPLARATGREYLALDANGNVPTDNRVKVADILRRVVAGYGVFANTDVYDGFIKFLLSKGYVENKDLFVFPYDWRLDNSTHLLELDQKIDAVLQATHQGKVILVAHSMGGLISRAYILSDRARASKVDTFISIGTPYWGAAKPYYALVSGYTFGNSSVNQLLMKELEQNFPAAYQLILTIQFVRDENKGRYLTMDETYKIWYDGVRSVGSGQCLLIGCERVPDSTARWTPNPNLVKQAIKFYASAGTKGNPTKLQGVNHYVIIGQGVSTLAEFSIRDPKPGVLLNEKSMQLGDDKRNIVMEPKFGDGDGTVPLAGLETDSANATFYVSYRPGDTTEHASLPSNKTVQEIVQAILSGSPPKPSDYPKKGVQNLFQPKDDASTDFSLHSDAHIRIIDVKSGRALGFNDIGGIDEDLPGTFLNINGVEYASIATSDNTYRVRVDGTNDGKFQLGVNQRSGGNISSFLYPEVEVKRGTAAEFQLNPRQITNSLPDLMVTTDGKTTRVSAQPINQNPLSKLIPALSTNGIIALGVGGAGVLCLLLSGLVAAVVITQRSRARSPRGDSKRESSPTSTTRPTDLPEHETSHPSRPSDLPE